MNKKSIILLLMLAIFLRASLTFAQNDEIVHPKDFSQLLSTLTGISDDLLNQHFQLYEGYVKSLNNLNADLKKLENPQGNATYSEYRAINISKPFAQNGVVLHELYFSNLSGKPTSPSALLNKYLTRDFGSYEKFISELKEAAKSARSGWVVTGYNNRNNKIYNYIVDLHDEHIPVFVVPLLVLDAWEHAYILDYGINKAEYIDAFIKNIDWDVVSGRLKALCKY